MVYEKFQQSGEGQQQQNGIDSARLVGELGAGAFKVAPPAAANIDQVFGLVAFESGDGQAVPQKTEQNKIDQLQKNYGIHVLRIITPSKTEFCVYQNEKLQFTTTGADLEAELKKQGFHELKDLGFEQNSSIDDYQNYVKRHYGLHGIQIVTPSKTSFAFYGRDNKLLSEGSLTDLQSTLAKNDTPRLTLEAPGKKIITHLPKGQTAIEYADGSEVILNADKKVASYTTVSGERIVPENAELTQWSTGNGASVKAKFAFGNDGLVSFEMLDERSEIAKRTYSGRDGVEDIFRDGMKVIYDNGQIKKVTTQDGIQIAFNGDGGKKSFTVTDKDGKVSNLKFESNLFRSVNEKNPELSEQEQLGLQKLFSKTYEKLGKLTEAIQHSQVLLNDAEKRYTPGSTEVADHHAHVADLRKRNGEAKTAAWHTREVVEVKRVADFLGRVQTAPDDLSRAFIVADALPGNLTLDTRGKVIKLDFSDAGKALEAIPGLRLPGTSDLSTVKAVSIEGNKFKIEGKGNLAFKIPNTEILADIKLDNVSADISSDRNDPTKLRLSNIRGLSIGALGGSLQPESLTLTTVKNADGSQNLKIEFGKLMPAVAADGKPSPTAAYSALLASQVKELQPVEIAVPRDVHLDKMFSEIRSWVKSDEGKDAGKMFEAIVGLYANTEISNIFKDITQMKKTGNKIEIETIGRNMYNIGGLPMSWDAKVCAELKRDGAKIALTNIEGVKAKIPLPADVANGLGMKNPMEIGIKEINLGEPDKEGNRIATIKTDSILETVSIKIGPRFEPIKDKDGNITVETILKKDDAQANVKLIANPEQLAKADPKNIDFSIQVTGGGDKMAQILQGFIGHELDPTVKELLGGIESITKKGDQFTIKRKAATNHDKSGMTFHVGQTVEFKFDPTKANLELKDINGIHITALPDVAGKIYGHKMPISMRYLSLSGADRNGERVLTLRADGVVSSATLYLDASMKPKEIIAVVENPAKCLKENLGNRDLIARRLDMVTKGKSYAIRIKGDGSVDLDGLGGVGGVADMLLNGGDLVSVEGAAATVVGYVGTSVTRGQAQANRGLAEKVAETWNYLFGDNK